MSAAQTPNPVFGGEGEQTFSEESFLGTKEKGMLTACRVIISLVSDVKNSRFPRSCQESHSKS